MSTNLDNIFLAKDKEIFIDELIIWLQDRKKKNLSKLKTTIKDGELIIELILS